MSTVVLNRELAARLARDSRFEWINSFAPLRRMVVDRSCGCSKQAVVTDDDSAWELVRTSPTLTDDLTRLKQQLGVSQFIVRLGGPAVIL